MKPFIKVALAALASSLFASAHASIITIETGNSFAGPQGSAAAYQSTVDAAVAIPAGGYGATNVASYDNISNQSLFGSNSSIAFKSTVNFGVSAGNSGTWEIRSGVDFGFGGAIFVDGVAYDFKTNDMWWDGSYSNPSQYFDISLNLGAGNHTLNIYGLEGCCDGGQQAQYKIGQGNFISFSNTDGLVAAVPEPATYGMMLTGLGLLALAARRKTAKVQA